jgi:hypothetical protein
MKGRLSASASQREYQIHEHSFVVGPRSKSGIGRDGKWHVCGEVVRHSHVGGHVPHTHPETGPSFYGYGAVKTSKRPIGEQGLPVIPRTEQEQTFELIVMDSALMSVAVPMGEKIPGLVPLGDTPIEALGFPAADRMISGFKMQCVVRDERKNARRA